jgi:hypothetical protein
VTIVKVTQTMINEGRVRSGENCPIALAILTVVAEEVYIIVRSTTTFISSTLAGTSRGVLENPPEVFEFINNFDDGHTVEPFEFSLDIPQEFLKQTI